MARRRRSTLAISAEQAQQALAFLVHEGKLAANDVRKAFAREKASRPARKRARHKITAATRRLYRLQGKYMSALRPLSKEARAGIKAIREKSGIDAAIAAAKRMVR